MDRLWVDGCVHTHVQWREKERRSNNARDRRERGSNIGPHSFRADARLLEQLAYFHTVTQALVFINLIWCSFASFYFRERTSRFLDADVPGTRAIIRIRGRNSVAEKQRN